MTIPMRVVAFWLGLVVGGFMWGWFAMKVATGWFR